MAAAPSLLTQSAQATHVGRVDLSPGGGRRLSPKPGPQPPPPRPRIPALSVAPHCRRPARTARLCARVWSARHLAIHPDAAAHDTPPRTGPHQRLRPTIPQTPSLNVPIPAAHGLPRRHFQGHRRTQSTQLHSESTITADTRTHSTPTHTHTHTHHREPDRSTRPVPPAAQPLSASVAGLDLPSSQAKFRAAGTGGGPGPLRGSAEGRGRVPMSTGLRETRSRVSLRSSPRGKDKRKPAERRERGGGRPRDPQEPVRRLQ